MNDDEKGGTWTSVLEELAYLRNVFIRVFATFVLFFILFFAVTFTSGQFRGVSVPVVGEGSTVASWAIERIKIDVLPSGIDLLVISPIDPFLAKSSVSAALALFFTLPLIALELWRFVAPGLYLRERRTIGLFLVASLLLSFLGVTFSYFFLIPLTIDALYGFSPPSTAAFFGLRAVVSMVTSLSMAVALIFLLPVAMVVLSQIGIVPASFWRAYARHALLIALIFSAIITPDGSGLTMALLTVPIVFLYGLGCAGSALFFHRRSLFEIKK